MGFLQGTWVWVLLVAGVLWLLSRGSLGCGMGRREPSNRTHDANRAAEPSDLGRGEPTRPEGAIREAESAGHRRHRSC